MQMHVDPFGVNSQLKIMSGYRGIQQGISLQLSTCVNPGQRGEHSSNIKIANPGQLNNANAMSDTTTTTSTTT